VKSSGSKPPGAAMFNMELLSVDEFPNEDDNIEVLDSLPLGSVPNLDDTVEDYSHKEPYIEEPHEDNFDRHCGPTIEIFCGYNKIHGLPEAKAHYQAPIHQIGDAYVQAMQRTLLACRPYPGDDHFNRSHLYKPEACFMISQGISDPGHYKIHDTHCGFDIKIPIRLLENSLFDLSGWYSKQRAKAMGQRYPPSLRNEALGLHG